MPTSPAVVSPTPALTLIKSSSMKKINLIFDGNFLYHLSFSVFSTYYRGEDMAAVLADKEKRQVLIRKCVTNLCADVRRFEDVKRVIVVIDSHSWRYDYYEDYKYALTRVKEPWYGEFIAVLGEFEALLRRKGLIVTRIPGAEGDDLLMMWALCFDMLGEEAVILTADSDIRQLITPHVSVFNYNSKFMKFYCYPGREEHWNEYFDTDIQVYSTEPFEVLLYKVIMGDKSDNIPKIIRGFGDKAFEKFIATMRIDGRLPRPPQFMGYDITKFALWIQSKLEGFGVHIDENQLGQIIANIKMTWLSVNVYDNSQMGFLMSMTEAVGETKDSYSYKKAFTLEDFYGMLIK